MFEPQREFITLAREAQRICDTNASWETKYDHIFSEQLSRRMFALIRLDYYGPDKIYKDDVLAFCRAATEKADDLEMALG